MTVCTWKGLVTIKLGKADCMDDRILYPGVSRALILCKPAKSMLLIPILTTSLVGISNQASKQVTAMYLYVRQVDCNTTAKALHS